MLLRVLVIAGTVADCTQNCTLIDGIFAEWLLADKSYDRNAIIAKALKQNTRLVILPKKNRLVQREYDTCLYRLHHMVENTFPRSNAGVELPLVTQSLDYPRTRSDENKAEFIDSLETVHANIASAIIMK